MTDRTQSASAPKKSQWIVFQPEHRILTTLLFIIALLGIFVGGYLYGHYLSARDLGGRDNVIEELRTESQKFKRQVDEEQAQLSTLQAKLDSAKAALDAIMPVANSYNISPNQTLIVADGHLMLGLIGSPGNEGVTLNVNGKQQTVAAGQVISVAGEGTGDCKVAVQSFDMFKAVLNASCTPPPKPQ